MKNSVSSSVSLQRSDDRGRITTDFSYEGGMPSMLVISQTINGKTNKVELTMKEAKFFRYVMNEFENFSHLIDQMHDEKKKDDWEAVDPIPTLGFGGGGGISLARGR